MDGSSEIQMPPEVMLSAILDAGNIAEMLPSEKLAGIGEDVCREHGIDFDSMKEWRGRMEKGIALASLVKDEKNYPFEKASNVRYPLITTAALQFNARAYPAIVPPDDMVKVQVFGQDAQGLKAARAMRVGSHMSWQLSSQIEEWEETTDELLTVLPIVGTVIRKVWHDPVQGRVRVRLIQGGAFVVNASVKTLHDAPRLGEVLSLYPSEIKERRLSGTFRDIEYVEVEGQDVDAPQDFIEQHRRLDLDGDGYGEPYIVTVHKKTRAVARIVADFDKGDVTLGDRGVVAIRRGSYFVAYHFLPPINGGFFGTGMGFLLGDISESINTIINMMMDAGHMASRGGGFIGSEFRIKGGSQQFKPGEWKMVQARGADVKSSLVPITFPSADATLFQLLGLLIDAGKEVASVKDIMTGDTGGRTMTATATMALIEQGMAVFTAAYKRIFRALKCEFKLIAKINAQTLDPESYNAFHDAMTDGQPVVVDPRADYSMADMDIAPVADPRSVTKMQEAAKAQILMEMSDKGLVDKGEAMNRILQAASVPDTEALAPKPDPMQKMMMEMQGQMMQAELALKMVAIDQALAQIEKTQSETAKTMTDIVIADAQIQIDAAAALGKIRDDIHRTLGRGLGGMASAPGFAGGAGMPLGSPAGPENSGYGGMVGGNPLAGSGTPFPAAF